MAKYECRLRGNFDELLHNLDKSILGRSMSASFEDGSDYQSGHVRCAVRVYERYSMIGKNRVSMSVTVIGNESDLFVSAITSGGSQAVLFKMNTFGEESFLEHAIDAVERYKQSR